MIGLRRAGAAGCRRASFRGFTWPRTRSTPGSTRRASEALRSKVSFLVVQDTTVTPLAQPADVVLAGATFAEKAGCYVNADGRLQYSEAALPPRDGSLPDLDLLAILLQPARRRAGRFAARSWPRWPKLIPAFGVAKGGKLPALGRGPGRAARRRRHVPAQRGRSPIPGSLPKARRPRTLSRRWPGGESDSFRVKQRTRRVKQGLMSMLLLFGITIKIVMVASILRARWRT